MPRFDLFPIGTKVTIMCVRGEEPGEVVEAQQPTSQQINLQPIIGNDFRDRVPVKWDRNGQVTWIVPSALKEAPGSSYLIC